MVDTQPSAEHPASIAIERFLSALTTLVPAQWDTVMRRAAEFGSDMTRDDVVRGAVVAIAVRHLLSPAQFALLYMPFAQAIPATASPLHPSTQN
ncbi:MAG: hypothetical protein M3010_03195 [Candidatus Dormibacteraeota bacterium]|nr:hypothetical protein [Candidatus Dormibacteraeota bacterium]